MAIIKQKNQSAQKNVNSFLINTRVNTKKGKIPSFGFGVAEQEKWIYKGIFKFLKSHLNIYREGKVVGFE